MTPQEYLNIWTEYGENIYPVSIHPRFNLKPETISFLEVGLPDDAAPFLGFYSSSQLVSSDIETLDKLYNLEAHFNKYVVIGHDGSGNPLAINTHKNDVIEWLDHEDNFVAFFVNSSIQSFLMFLSFYRDFIEVVIVENGENAFIDAEFTDQQFEGMKQRMMIDAQAVDQTGFWNDELKTLLVNREYYRNNPNG